MPDHQERGASSPPGGAARRTRSVTLIHEDFERYDVGPFSEPCSALGEFHYPPHTIFRGPWEEIASHHLFPSYGVGWAIERRGAAHVLRQTGTNRSLFRSWKSRLKKAILRTKDVPLLYQPALALGDPLWREYRLRAALSVGARGGRAGIVFRVQDGRHHYLFCLDGGGAVLLKREDDRLETLARRHLSWEPGRERLLEARVCGDELRCFVDGREVLATLDPSYPAGRVGIFADTPAEFRRFEVEMPAAAHEQLGEALLRRAARRAELARTIPRAELWKTMELPNCCSGRSLRFGSLAGGEPPVVVAAQGCSELGGDNYNRIACVTALDLDGTVLWRRGEPRGERLCLSSDLPLQLYDIDGDGTAEVICARDGFLQILDGRTGEVKKQNPTPPSVPPLDRVPRVLGDAVFICNLSGGERAREILLKDRYSKVWAYDAELRPLWDYHYAHGEMGHFPCTADLDGDGRDEVLVGYALLGPDGRPRWDLRLSDHADAVAMFRSPLSGQWVVAVAASDEGFILADGQGRIRRHVRLGHMQTVTAARLRDDRPGLQIATNTFWGNPGIITILDESGNRLTSFQPSVYGSPLVPVNWVGDGLEHLLLSAAPGPAGGLYDGRGDQALELPDDGHPTLCCDAVDLNGDGLDEIVCWDHERLWVYRRAGAAGRSWPRPRRNPAPFNASNYRSYVSGVGEAG